jgi:hypothetical protein
MSAYRPGILERSLVHVSDSIGTAVLLGLTLVVIRLMSISNYDTQTALAVANGADLFSLIFSLFVSAFAITAGIINGALLVVCSQRYAEWAVVPTSYTMVICISSILMLVTTPLTLINWLPAVFGLLSLVVACAQRPWHRLAPGRFFRLVSAMALTGVIALAVQNLCFNSSPFGHPRLLVIKEKYQDAPITGTIVGYPLGAPGEQTTLLEYEPRQVIVLPTRAVVTAQICSMSATSDRTHPTVAAWLAHIVAAQKKIYVPSAKNPDCFNWS